MKSFIVRAAAVAVGLAVAVPATAADVALVIANYQYDGRSPIRDIRTGFRDLIRAYDRDGFEVISGQNTSSTELAELLREFEEAAADADRVVVHFNGYVEPSNQNLRLVTRDMRKGSLVGAHYATPSLDLIYELVDHRPGRSAVFISTPQSGVGAMIANGPHIPQGVWVMAGKPRTLNRALQRSILAEDNPPNSLASYADTTATGYISEQPFTPPSVASSTTGTAADDATVEMRAWRTAAQNGGREALEQYLDRYPNGLFAREAKARIAALEPQVSPEEKLEEALRLTRAQRRGIQRNLTLLGFDTRGVDGISGNGSRRAISAWQRSVGFRDTGFLDRAQIRVMEEAAKDKQDELDAKAEADRAARDREDLAYWQATGASGSAEDLRAYLGKYPNGLFAPQAKRLLATLPAPDTFQENPAALAVEQKLNLNGQTRRLVEQRLAGLGLNPGPVDGQFDAATRHAIMAFQEAKRLRATGYLNSDTVGQLIVSVFQ